MEASGVAGCLALFVCDLRERHQGEHDAGGSHGRYRTDLPRDVREGRERCLCFIFVIMLEPVLAIGLSPKRGSITNRRKKGYKRERSGPCDPLLPHMSEASP